jgi:hypothetical protein
LIGGGKAIAAKAMDASLHGLRLALGEDALASTAIRHGESCAVEVHVPHSEARFFRQAEVRHVGEHDIGLVISEPLPAVLVPSLREAVTDTTAPSPPASGDDRTSIMLRLRSLAFALRRR